MIKLVYVHVNETVYTEEMNFEWSVLVRQYNWLHSIMTSHINFKPTNQPGKSELQFDYILQADSIAITVKPNRFLLVLQNNRFGQ